MKKTNSPYKCQYISIIQWRLIGRIQLYFIWFFSSFKINV